MNYGYLNIDGHGHIRVLAQTIQLYYHTHSTLIMSITAIRTADE